MYGENIFDKIEHKLKAYYKFDDPYALEWGAWDDYRAKYKSVHPVMYFIFRTCIHGVIRQFWSVSRHWNTFWQGVRNRFVTKPATVNIQTLSKYRYHDPMEVLLHANFQILVDFVEWEVGVFDRPKWYKTWRSIPIVGYFAPPIRSAAEGLKHLEWESNLTYDSNYVGEGDPRIGLLTEQALAAIEKRDLYLWWKNVRPLRVDPMDLSGLSAYHDSRNIDNVFAKKSDDDWAKWKILSDECQRIEKMYSNEDENNLIRLVRIREYLWT